MGKKADIVGFRIDNACAGYSRSTFPCSESRTSAHLQAVQHRDDTGTKKLGLLVAKELDSSVK